MKRERQDHVVFRTNKRADGSKGVEVHTPLTVLPVYNRDELKYQLQHYAKLLTHLTTVDSVEARRHYVELIRPALRYYCKKFQVETPEWLKSDDYYTKVLSASERQRMFGLKPLRIGEFQKLKPIPGAEPARLNGEEPNAGAE